MPLRLSSARNCDRSRRKPSSPIKRSRIRLSFGSGTLDGPQTQTLQQLFVLFWCWIRRSQKPLSSENGIGAGQEAKHHRLLRHLLTSCCETDSRGWHQHPCRRNSANHHERINLGRVCEGRSMRPDQAVDRYALRMRIKTRELL